VATPATSGPVAALGRGGWGLPQRRARPGPVAEPRRSRAGVSLDKQRSDLDGPVWHVRGHRPVRGTCYRRALFAFIAAGNTDISDYTQQHVQVTR
jgi:hypothetical protein